MRRQKFHDSSSRSVVPADNMREACANLSAAETASALWNSSKRQGAAAEHIIQNDELVDDLAGYLWDTFCRRQTMP